jgi:hypothetical protein
MKYILLKYHIFSLITLYIFFTSCSNKKDIKSDLTDSLSASRSGSQNLQGIDEVIPGYDYKEIIDKYQKMLPQGFSVTKYRYFIIFSELDENQTYSLIENDVKKTSAAMTENYVNKLPDVITPIIIFNDYDRYKGFVLKNYDIEESDISPYGFFKISKNVIVVRYVSWKGSIMHEVTHRFLRSDFPEIPSWFDEGFAALHEKSTYKNGVLSGDFSWRIISIRRAFENNNYTGLKTLMESSDDELYGPRSSFYYAQSRYLLMMLQQKGLLKDYYILFRDTYSTDETGITQLEKVMKKTLSEIDYELIDYLKSFK